MGRKRKKGTGGIHLRKDGRWEGRVVIGYDDKGLPKTKNVLAKTKMECQEKLKVLKASVDKPTPSKAKADMPFGEWMDFWFETYCKPDARPGTVESYGNFIRLYLRPKLGHIPLNKLTTNDIQQFYVWMRTDGRSVKREERGEGLSDNVLQSCHSVCRKILDQAVAEHLIHINPANNCKLPTVHRKEMQVLNREEMQKLLIQAKHEGYYELFLVELSTGLRIGELLALQWDDLNFNTGELKIDKQILRNSKEPAVTEPKTQASIRTIILPPSVLKVLKEYRKTVNSRWLFPSSKREDAPLAPCTVQQRFGMLLKHAGIKRIRFHDLRHTFATNALKYGMDVKTLSTIIGHISSRTTLNVYTHVTDEMKQKAAVTIDRGIGKAEPQEVPQTPQSKTMTDFQPAERTRRKPGTGHIKQIHEHRWSGRCTMTWPDGTTRIRTISGKTEEECEEKLAKLIAEMKAEAAAEKERLKEKAMAS